jgi:hypothetical protein
MRTTLPKIITILLLFSIFIKNSLAEDKKRPNIISGLIKSEIFATNYYKSNDNQNEFYESNLKNTLDLFVKISQNLSIKTKVKFSKIRKNSKISNKNYRYFENYGLYLEKLYLTYDYKNISIFTGKDTINFGQAWNTGDYIWALDMSKRYYKFINKFSLGGSISTGSAKDFGKFTLTTGSFFNDEKINNSLVTKKDIDHNLQNQAGSDMKLLSSYYAILDINYDFKNNEKLSYHFGHINSSINPRQIYTNSNKAADQKSFIANIKYQYPLSEEFIIIVFLEHALLKNYLGDVNKEHKFLSKRISLDFYKNYHLVYAESSRKYTEIGYNGIDEDMNELSFGYKFNQNHILNGLNIFLGTKKDIIDYKSYRISTKSYGLYARYNYYF